MIRHSAEGTVDTKLTKGGEGGIQEMAGTAGWLRLSSWEEGKSWETGRCSKAAKTSSQKVIAMVLLASSQQIRDPALCLALLERVSGAHPGRHQGSLRQPVGRHPGNAELPGGPSEAGPG